jgi:glycogen debranching enzyme
MSSDLAGSPSPVEMDLSRIGPAGGGPPRRGPYYIQAPEPRADQQSRVLKQGDTFAVFDHDGDVTPSGLGDQGIYHEGTRYLSSLLLAMDRVHPLFLSSTIRDDNDLLAVDLTNPDFLGRGPLDLRRGQLHLSRTKFLWQGVCYERLEVQSYQAVPTSIKLGLHYEADFADIFEVRGTRRKARGQLLSPIVDGSSVILPYRGLDGVMRRTRLVFTPRPTQMSGSEVDFELTLPPRGKTRIEVAIVCERQGTVPTPLTYDQALHTTAVSRREGRQNACTVRGSHERFTDWVHRAEADLHMMISSTPYGLYPYAGVPWFSTPFGRDGIVTALMCLWLNPALARGVLAYLAATQAREVNPTQDAQPGKILHETRGGEMAALGEIPFGRYYGSVDATPLFIHLAAQYHERTADLPFIESIWPNLEAALRWIDEYGDVDRDGLVEYARTSPQGLVNQGWKDSHDAIFHADGTFAQGPIALCEVQGYVYAAKRGAAHLAALLGRKDQARELLRQAQVLQERFEELFWCEDLSTYALALDGNKRPCRVRSSNAGQCLFTGIVHPNRALLVAHTLLSTDSFSGWGVRTIAATEALYNPMSYHNGSVWPHDNALIALGLDRYRQKKAVLEITTGLFDASLFMDLLRLPELFCGFPRRDGSGPTLYPVACAPQAWSAAAVYLLVQSCLGMSISGPQAQICFSYPVMPGFLRELRIHNLQVGAASVDLLLQRHDNDVGINVLRRNGDVAIHMVK